MARRRKELGKVGKLYAGVNKAIDNFAQSMLAIGSEKAEAANKFIAKVLKDKKLNKDTIKEVKMLNRRLKKWENEGYQKNLIRETLNQIKDIDGITIYNNRIIATKDLSEYDNAQLEKYIATWSKLEKENASLAKKVREEEEYTKKREQQMIARARFYAIQKKLEKDGVDNLFSLWYEDDGSGNKVKSTAMVELEKNNEGDFLSLENELKGHDGFGLASRMARDEATPEEIFDFINRLQEAMKK